ncbi:response regulator transcription factor [Bacillus daqingensis]|uniref:Response regulator transcription factor n=1 Tax=Bacillus daqingensis TaxID=872396 RepID=A0ABV9NZI1_9BACI
MRVLIGMNHELMRHGLVQLLYDLGDIDYMVTAATREELYKSMRLYSFTHIFVHTALPGALSPASFHQEAGAGVYLIGTEEDKSRDLPLYDTLSLDEWMRRLSRIMRGDLKPGAVVLQSSSAEELTLREEEAVRMRIHGYTVRETAAVLGISEKTVENHRRSAAKKLHIASSRDWMAFGRSKGFI